MIPENKKARLLFTSTCNRHCKGCCNRNWKGEPAKEIKLFELITHYKEIYITGGEPMLYPDSLKCLVNTIKHYNPNMKIYLYTALPWNLKAFKAIMDVIDGCTVTLHNYDDRKKFFETEEGLATMNFEGKEMRLNTFVGVGKYKSKVLPFWDVRKKVWIKDAPLPDGEDFVKLAI